MNVYVSLPIFIIIILIFSIGVKIRNNKKSIVLISIFIILLVSIVGSFYIMFSNNEQYIKINENNREVSIKLKNHKEYYGYKFYRFSSFNSESEIIKELKKNGYDSYYNQESKSIIINYQNNVFEIRMEKKEELLSRNRYNYIFLRQNNQ